MARKNTSPQGPPFAKSEVAEAFASLPPQARDKLMQLRALIFQTAVEMPEVGPLEEALRWGEPSYLTRRSKAGTTIRIHWKPRQPEYCAMYVHCQTTLVEQYRQRHLEGLTLDGNRAVLFRVDEPLPETALRECVQLALTYHLR